MPQEFQVLQCYSCQLFQVHNVKKSLKWQCKVCGEKQSILKVFGTGTSKDCREMVQHCNETYIDKNDNASSSISNSNAEKDVVYETNDTHEEPNLCNVSKWSKYVNHIRLTTQNLEQTSVDTLDTNSNQPDTEKNIFEEKEVNLDTLLDI